jgi:hypothetical protein
MTDKERDELLIAMGRAVQILLQKQVVPWYKDTAIQAQKELADVLDRIAPWVNHT